MGEYMYCSGELEKDPPHDWYRYVIQRPRPVRHLSELQMILDGNFQVAVWTVLRVCSIHESILMDAMSKNCNDWRIGCLRKRIVSQAVDMNFSWHLGFNRPMPHGVISIEDLGRHVRLFHNNSRKDFVVVSHIEP